MRALQALAVAAGPAVAVALAIAAWAAPTRAEEPSGERPFESISGTIRAVSPEERKMTIEGADGAVTLDFDRNTSVWLETRLGTVRDLAVGAEVRAQFGRDRRAAWIEVRGRSRAAPARERPREATTPARPGPAGG